jgi:hypothetical protein
VYKCNLWWSLCGPRGLLHSERSTLTAGSWHWILVTWSGCTSAHFVWNIWSVLHVAKLAVCPMSDIISEILYEVENLCRLLPYAVHICVLWLLIYNLFWHFHRDGAIWEKRQHVFYWGYILCVAPFVQNKNARLEMSPKFGTKSRFDLVSLSYFMCFRVIASYCSWRVFQMFNCIAHFYARFILNVEMVHLSVTW